MRGQVAPFPATAHSTRAFSASWASRHQVYVPHICKAATWSTGNTFRCVFWQTGFEVSCSPLGSSVCFFVLVFHPSMVTALNYPWSRIFPGFNEWKRKCDFYPSFLSFHFLYCFITNWAELPIADGRFGLQCGLSLGSFFLLSVYRF